MHGIYEVTLSFSPRIPEHTDLASRKRLSPRKAPTQERAKATVSAILEAGSQVLGRYGFADSTTDRIAKRAGVSIGTLYQYFPNKRSILHALAEVYLERLYGGLAEVVDMRLERRRPRSEVLRELVETALAFHVRAARLHAVLWDQALFTRKLRTKAAKRERSFGEKLQDGLGFSPVASYLAVHAINGVLLRHALERPDDIDSAELVDELVIMLNAIGRR